MPRGVLDGTMLRISFTADGHFASDRIEVQNLWLPWLSAVTEAISAPMPDAEKIQFREQIERRNRMLNWRADWPTDVIPIEKYYAAPEQPASPPPANAPR